MKEHPPWPSCPSASPEPASTLDSALPQVPDHELLRRIGSGSYGEVWLARNVMGTYRAIKVVYRRTFTSDRPYEREFNGMKMFEPVSRSHDSLVDILQIGRNDEAGYFYSVMEVGDDVLEGQQVDPDRYEPKTLSRELTRRGRLPFTECVDLGLSLASGLGHLHDHGLIHRDIKPSNIIFVNGIPKIADIGLVTEAGGARSFVGTEGFIPPEGPGTAQADLYSLGKVLYEISSGKDRQAFPQLPTRLHDLQDREEYLELNAVILKACEEDLNQRYQTAEDLRADLLLLEAGKSVRRLRTLERRLALARKTGVGIAALILLAGAVSWQVYQGKQIAVRALVRSYVASGVQELNQGDLLRALPWFAKALGLNPTPPAHQETHRARLATTSQLCPRITRTFFEDGWVYYADSSPDGQCLVTACGSKLASVWRLSNGQRVLQLQGHADEVETACFSPDGSLILTSSNDGTARVWDAASGTELEDQRLTHPRNLASAFFSPDGRRIVTACADGKVRIWEGTPPQARAIDAHPDAAVRHAAFSPDGCLVVSAGEDGIAQVWDADTLRPVGPAFAHASWVYQAAFSPDGRYIATAGYDHSARVWDLRTGLQIRRWEHNGPMRSAQFSPDGRWIVTGGWEDCAARLWDFESGKEIQPRLWHSGYIMHAAFCRDGRRIITANMEQSVRLWDLAASHWAPPTFDATFSVDARRYATVTNQTVCLHSMHPTHAGVVCLRPNPSPAHVVLNTNGRAVVTLSEPVATSHQSQRLAQCWNSLTGEPASEPFPVDAAFTNVCLNSDASRALLYADTTAELYRLPSNDHKPFARWILPKPIGAAAFHPTLPLAFTVSHSDVVLWNSTTGTRERTISLPDEVSRAAFSPNGALLATACYSPDGMVRASSAQLWDVRTGRAVGNPLAHSDDVNGVAFSPAGDRIVTFSEDRTAQVWWVKTGQRASPALRHEDHVIDAAFSPDGRWIVTACQRAWGEDTAQVWDATTGEAITPRLSHADLKTTRFTADGQQILSRGRGGTRIWPLFPNPSFRNCPIDDLNLLARVFSGHFDVEVTSAVLPDPAVLREDWRRLQRRLSVEYFEATPDQARYWDLSQAEARRRWHRQEAETCEATQQWFATSFHLDRLLALQPADPDLIARRANAQKLLQHSAKK
jgi:WD40 repeat protein